MKLRAQHRHQAGSPGSRPTGSWRARRSAPRLLIPAVALTIAMTLATLGVDAGARTAPDALSGLVARTKAEAAEIAQIAQRLDGLDPALGTLLQSLHRSKVTLSTIQRSVRNSERDISQRTKQLLAAVSDALAPTIPAEIPATTVPPSAFWSVDEITQTSRTGSDLAARIVAEGQELGVLQANLTKVSTGLGGAAFALGRDQKAAAMLLSEANRALRLVGGSEADRTAERSRAEATATAAIESLDSELQNLAGRQAEVRKLGDEVAAVQSLLDRHRTMLTDWLNQTTQAITQLEAAIASDSLIFTAPSTSTGGGCVRSSHSTVRLSDVAIAAVGLAAGFRGFDLAVAVAIALEESGGDPGAVCFDSNGSRDEGLWQINTIHGEAPACTMEAFCNGRVAYGLYVARGNAFTDWMAYIGGAYVAFLSRGMTAAAAVGQEPFTVFGVCPVDQPRSYSDDFGAPRYTGGYHPHAGNDVSAPAGTPIRAPFEGNAVAGSSTLGGLTVTVYGSAGHVYNAHLSKYGALGAVSTGTIIGYVGETGDATGPHDHVEWHPAIIPAQPWQSPYGYTEINGAIDPYPYLSAVC